MKHGNEWEIVSYDAVHVITDPIKLLEICVGPCLEKAACSLVSQPTELQELLIPQLWSMLSIVVNIFQRIGTLAK